MNPRSLVSPLALTLLLVSTALGIGCGEEVERAADSAARDRPNIVLVIADDLGYGDLGFMGAEHVPTPRIDALANAGFVFPNGYGTASVCVPSLRTLLTGLDPEQWVQRARAIRDVTGVVTPRLEQARLMRPIPARLAAAGYRSFQGGKLWESGYEAAGFDAGTVEEFEIDLEDGHRGALDVPLGRSTMQPLFDFIDREPAEPGPFFVWFAPKLPHAPFDASRDLKKRFRGKGHSRNAINYYANIVRLDRAVGQLVDHLESRDLLDDTLIVFVSDNGWHQPLFEDPPQSPPFDWDGPKGKRSMYDVGFRTPIVFRLPGRVPIGRRDALVSTLDLVPTLIDYAGLPASEDLPGVSLRPLIEGRDDPPPRVLVGAMQEPRRGAPAPDSGQLDRWRSEPGAYFVRTPRWHYIWRPFVDVEELYDVSADPLEENDLAAAHPQLVARMRRRVNVWRISLRSEAAEFAEAHATPGAPVGAPST